MKTIENYLTDAIRERIKDRTGWEDISEIRLRVNCPMIVKLNNKEIIFNSFIISEKELENVFNIITEYSAYAYEDAIKCGYLTVEGGHRIGFGGEAVIKNEKIVTIKNIKFMNIRVSHVVDGCGKKICRELLVDVKPDNTLIISPPGVGKTTLLRDLIKIFSINVEGTSICVIDERNEISGSYMGVPAIDLGWRTDVISNCSKEDGIMMAVRSLAPQIIAVDEIGGENDIKAINYASRCGVNIIATIHGNSLNDARLKLGQAFDNIFSKKILIKGKGEYICY